MSKLLLLDGHSLAYRAFFALPTDLATSSGTVTNAVYGFTSMLAKVVADEQPDLLGVAFDTPAPTFRKEMDESYKATRRETPDLFRAQLPLIREVLQVLGVSIVELAGVEADDVIATLATAAAGAGIDTTIVTGDRDAFQLVEDPHLEVLYNKRGVSEYARYDEAGILERTGVSPAQYLDYAALRGDASDNLPGVPGIGEKTAAKLVATYGDLEGLFAHLEALTPKQRENLGASREQVFHNRAMSRLRRDCEVGVTVADLATEPVDAEALRELCTRLEFRTLYPRLAEAFGVAAAPEEAAGATGTRLDVEVARLASAAELRTAVGTAVQAGLPVALEGRWAGARGRSDLLGLALATPAGAWYAPASALGRGKPLAALVGPGGPPLCAHGAKELMHGLAPLEVRTLARDTEVMAYLVEPGARAYELDDLVARHLGTELVSPDAGDGRLDLDGDAAPEETGRRAVAVLALGDALAAAIESRELTDVYERMERPLVRVLARMERAGVLVDTEFLDHLRAELTKECDALVGRLHAAAGGPFNVNSTPQLRHVLFEELGLTPVKRTKTGPSTDADSLQKLQGQHPIIDDLLRYREVEKLRNTYAEALPRLVESDGRIHATFNQTATTTGRISSEAPNLQNIPVRTAEGREMRRAFVAPEGAGLLTADYSQIELRVLAHLARDPGLVDAFVHDRDVHTITAARVFGVDEDRVDEFQRRFAKVVNYGLAYGMEAYGLSQRLDISVDQAREILDNYFESFPAVHAYMEQTIADARSRGYTTTLFGRRRQIPELGSDNFRVRQMGERMAQNAPVQGTAADLFKLAMIAVQERLEADGLGAEMILTVHDELVFEVALGERERLEELVREVMGSVADLTVPLVVDVGFGPSWAEAK